MADIQGPVVDIAEAEDPPGVAPSDQDVVVLRDEGTEDELPANAALQPDGSVILTLRFPITMRYTRASTGTERTEQKDSLHMHRMNGAAMRAVMAAPAGHAVPVGIAKSLRIEAGLFNALYDRMDAADATAAAQVFSFFLGGGTKARTGPPSSR